MCCVCLSDLKAFFVQGHIWRSGYSKGDLQGAVFDDVPGVLAEWHRLGTKVGF